MKSLFSILMWLVVVFPILITILLSVINIIMAINSPDNFFVILGFVLLGGPMALYYFASKIEVLFFSVIGIATILFIYKMAYNYSHSEWYKPSFKVGATLILLNISIVAGNIILGATAGLAGLG